MSNTAIASRAQASDPIRLTVPAYGRASSPALTARAGETVAVRPSEPGALVPAIFIYDSAQVLVAKNDEGPGSGVFEWTVPRDSTLHVVIYSNSAAPLEYSIAVLPPAPTRDGNDAEPSHAVLRVLFATDRRIETRRPLVFDTEAAPGNQISYGTCLVSLPRGHQLGELEGPSIWRLEFRPYPDRHVVVLSKELADPARFFGAAPNFQVAAFLTGYCDTDDRRGRAVAGAAARWYLGDNEAPLNRVRFGPDFDRARFARYTDDALVRDNMVVGGDPDTCSRVIEAWARVGVDQLILMVQAGLNTHDQVMRSIELLGGKVLPRFADAP